MLCKLGFTQAQTDVTLLTVCKHLAEITSGLLAIISARYFRTNGSRRVKMGKHKLLLQKGGGAIGSYRPVSLTLQRRKVSKQTEKGSVCEHVEWNKVKLIRNSHVFVMTVNGKSRRYTSSNLANPVEFFRHSESCYKLKVIDSSHRFESKLMTTTYLYSG